MMEEIKRKFTEEECVANGGHFWKYWSHLEEIDHQTFNKTGRVYAVYCPNGAIQYRGCPLCGKIERHIDRWE